MMEFDEAFNELIAAGDQPGDNFARRGDAEEQIMSVFKELSDDHKNAAFHVVMGALSECMFRLAFENRKRCGEVITSPHSRGF